MDTIILAGGKGSRLDGVMPPYLKPIMPISGKPLICRLVDQAQAATRPSARTRTIVVVAPENALQISQILGDRKAILVVQRNAKGPGDALDLALSVSDSRLALVLMGDNLMPDENIAECANIADFVVGYDTVPYEQAKRFTRIYELDDNTTYFEEGPYPSQNAQEALVWSGPLVLPVEETRTALAKRMSEDVELGEHKIGPHLNKLVSECGNPTLIKCQNVDIGIPEAIVQVTT